MEKLQPHPGQHATVTSRSRMQDVVFAATKPVDVVTVDVSWWRSRVNHGVHVYKPTRDKLEFAKDLARRLGTYTVYVYVDKPQVNHAGLTKRT